MLENHGAPAAPHGRAILWHEDRSTSFTSIRARLVFAETDPSAPPFAEECFRSADRMQPSHEDVLSTGSQAEILRAIVRDAYANARDIAPAPLTATVIREIASLGLAHPERLSAAQIRKLCGSLLAHVAPLPS